MAYTGNESLNLNPFAEGGTQFPVDPTGFYQPVYETLFRFNPMKADYQGVLAESYTVKAGVSPVTLKPDVFGMIHAIMLRTSYILLNSTSSFRHPKAKSFRNILEIFVFLIRSTWTSFFSDIP